MVRLLDVFLGGLERRVETRVENRVVRRVEATLDVLSDPKLLEDLERADSQPDEAARPLEEVLRGRRAQTQT